MMRPVGICAVIVAVFLAGLAPFAWSQDQPKLQPKVDKKDDPRSQVIPLPPNHPQNRSRDPNAILDLRRRLIELDRLLSLQNLSRAESLLAELKQHSVLQRELVTREIRLAQLKGDHARAIELSREVLASQPRNPTLWRELAVSLLATDQPDTARWAIDQFIATNPNGRSAAIVGVDLLLQSGESNQAVALIDSMRTVLAEPRFLGRQRAVGLLALGQQEEAAKEVSLELRSNPFNISLLRTELLDGPYSGDVHGPFVAALIRYAAEPGARVEEVLLAANLKLASADLDGALELASTLKGRLGSDLPVLQNSVTLTRELGLLEDTDLIQATVDYLLVVLEEMATSTQRDLTVRRRSADLLAEVCETALLTGTLGPDPAASVARFGELLEVVRKVNPASERLYSSQIKLAAYTRDELDDPALAARRLEHMLLDLDIPTEGVALIRLTLGECYLAAGDTARGRVVLDNLSRDPMYRQAAGHAHYHLARLDLSQGQFGTARDRFAVIALDNPAAPYANESLDLGLAISEEMENPSGGPSILQMYAPVVYYDLVALPEERLLALEDFVREAGLLLDPAEPQHLLERARFDLAVLLAERLRYEEALAMLSQVVLQHPDGRFPGRALQLRGEILLEMGRGQEARAAWEQLLAQYPDYLFIDDVRDELRGLPN